MNEHIYIYIYKPFFLKKKLSTHKETATILEQWLPYKQLNDPKLRKGDTSCLFW